MNKKIIALAVAAAFTAPIAAQAAVTTYGHAQVEFGSWGGDDGVVGASNKANNGETVEDAARGRIGFKASEDLGNGLKAMAKFEFKVDTADGNSDGGIKEAKVGAGTDLNNDGDTKDTVGQVSLQKREMMIGLKGGFGEVQAGRLKTAYKYTGGVKYDAYVATLLEARGNGGMTGKVGSGALGKAAGHNGFVSDSVAYKNKFGNMHFWLTYDLDSGKQAGTEGNAMTAALKYKAKNWEAFVALVDDDATVTASNGKQAYDATKFGGSYKFGAHKINVQVESGTFDKTGSTNDSDVDAFYVNYSLKMGKNTLDVAVGNEEFDNFGSADDEDTDFLRVAFRHSFSKNTSVWVGHRSSETNVVATATQGNESEDVTSLGMRVKF